MKLVALVLSVVLGCSACGEEPAARSAADATRGAAGGPAAGQRSVALSFEAKKQGSKPFPFAFVEGKIGDQSTRFLIDTGASAHGIDATLAQAAHVAAPVKASAIAIEGWGALAEHGVAVVELPASIRAHGIGGILSPQLLAQPGQAVVLDLVKMQMRELAKSAAWSQVDDLGAALTPQAQRFCPAEAGGIPGLLVAVDGTVDGEPTRFAIDTGASRSLLLEGSKGGAKAAGHPVLGRSVASSAMADVPASIHGGVPVALGAWATTLDFGVTPGERNAQCAYEGRIGMDVLQHCAIAMTTDDVRVACRIPGR